MARTHLALSLPLFALLAACGKEKATVVLVSVGAKEGVVAPASCSDRSYCRQATALEATLTNGGEKLPNIFSKGGTAITFPTDFVVQANNRDGEVELALKAKSETDTVLGEGSGKTTLLLGGKAELLVTLLPTDFQVNARSAGDQFFSTESGFGRQVASAADGSFVTVFEDNGGGQQRYDVYVRSFDRGATAKLNAATGSREEAVANGPGDDYYDMPTVAVQPETGNFVAAWQRYTNKTEAAPASRIYGRAFTPEGRPDTAANNGAEFELTGTEVNSTGARGSVPHIVALKDRGYVVVWQQLSGTNWEIKARYLGANGAPAKAANDKNEPFSVASFAAVNSTTKCTSAVDCVAGQTCGGAYCIAAASPMVAAGVNQGFLVAWNENGAARGRPYALKGAALKDAFPIDATKTGLVKEVNVAPLPYGYAVIWSDALKTGSDSDGTSIRLRRFTLGGDVYQVGETEFTLNTTTTGEQRFPALAARADGSLLAVWSTWQADDTGRVWGRRLLSNFLPVGDDFVLSSTLVGRQEKPAIASHTAESFVVIFVDHSKTPPDTIGTGVRGRLVYPDFRASDGKIGALCDATTCNASLSCKPTETGVRCVSRCVGPGSACPNGGVCKTLSGDPPEQVCMYNK